ncbi:MAG: hypothetical protein ACPLZH_00155 [Minisyncoccales bacterium]
MNFFQLFPGQVFINPITQTLPDFLIAVFNELLRILWFLTPFVLMYAAITIITSRGEPAKIHEAKKIIFWTVFTIALVVGGAQLIILLIKAFGALF